MKVKNKLRKASLLFWLAWASLSLLPMLCGPLPL